jgi:alpha-1,3-mannosyltransferase
MLRVLHVCTDFWPSTGGIQFFVRELSKRSRAVGVDAAVLCCNRTKGHPGKLPKKDCIDGVPITRAPFLDLRFYKPTSFFDVTLRDFDVIHVHGLGAQLDYLALSKGIHRRPIILSTHGAIFHTESLRWLKQHYFYRLQPFILGRVDLVAACSRNDADLFCKVSQNVQLLENAVNVDELLALPSINKCRTRCLYVGRLAPSKGIDTLLKVFAFAKRHGAKFELRIVGPDSSKQGHLYEAMAQELALSECVRFLGAVDPSQLVMEYERADIFVSASRYEGFGISAIEARAAGCRLLLHRNDAFSLLFDQDSAVTLTDYSSVDEAGTALMNLLEDHGDGETGRFEMQQYSWGQKMNEWLTVYRQVAGAQ